MKNPIIDNRMVSSHTYAVRNLSFLCSVYPNIPNSTCSSMDEEEYEYMCHVACDLLRYQVATCPESERWYFENLLKDYKDGNDLIRRSICKLNPDFIKFLEEIGAIRREKRQ